MIRLSKSTITNKEKKSVASVLDDEFLGMGKHVKIFENNLTKYIGREAVCVSSGTAALHLACQSINLKKGDEVLVQSITYLSSFQAISATGAIPIPCEINADNLTIDLEDAKNKITKRTKAIMPVHYAGGVGDLNSIYKFAKENRLRVIEDAAHAFGSVYKKKRIGSFGDIVCFSFDGIKNITCGEGGAIFTSDKKSLEHVKSARLLGVIDDSIQRYKNKRTIDARVEFQGWRYHMSNINAAIGIEQLKRIKIIGKKRRSLAKQYDKNFNGVKNIKFVNQNYDEVLPHIYPIFFKTSKLRNKIKHALFQSNIETGLHYKPNHLLKYFKTKFQLNLSESTYKRILTLPLHIDLKIKDVNRICEIIKSNIPKN